MRLMRSKKSYRTRWVMGLSAALCSLSGWVVFPAAFAESLTASPVKDGVIPGVKMPTPPKLQAVSAVLMDADNGQILYAKNPDERRAPASTTKIMTMLLVMQAVAEHRASWTDEVPVTPDAYQVGTMPDVSSAYLDPKEHFTLEDMMKFVAVISANDATVAIADKLAGSKQNFVAEMNKEAQTLGLTGTHYMNPDGLPQDGHYTTARDLATLARYLVTEYPQVLTYTSMKDVTVRKGNTWPNTDQLLGKYPGIDGLKTGFTQDAGYCFVGTAERDGVRLISVVMGDPSEAQRFADTKALFDYGFSQFHEAEPVQANSSLPDVVNVSGGRRWTIHVKAKDNLIVDLPQGVQGQVQVHLKPATAPVHQGDAMGEIDYVVNGATVASVPAVAAEDDPKANFLVRGLRGLFMAIGRWLAHV